MNQPRLPSAKTLIDYQERPSDNLTSTIYSVSHDWCKAMQRAHLRPLSQAPRGRSLKTPIALRESSETRRAKSMIEKGRTQKVCFNFIHESLWMLKVSPRRNIARYPHMSNARLYKGVAVRNQMWGLQVLQPPDAPGSGWFLAAWSVTLKRRYCL